MYYNHQEKYTHFDFQKEVHVHPPPWDMTFQVQNYLVVSTPNIQYFKKMAIIIRAKAALIIGVVCVAKHTKIYTD